MRTPERSSEDWVKHKLALAYPGHPFRAFAIDEVPYAAITGIRILN